MNRQLRFRTVVLIVQVTAVIKELYKLHFAVLVKWLRKS